MKIGKQWFFYKYVEWIGLIWCKCVVGLVVVVCVEGDGCMLMDIGFQVQGMVVVLMCFCFQCCQQFFFQLLVVVLGIDIDLFYFVKVFFIENNSFVVNGFVLWVVDCQGDDCLWWQLVKVQQVVVFCWVEGFLSGVEGGNQGDKFGVGRGDVGDGVYR